MLSQRYPRNEIGRAHVVCVLSRSVLCNAIGFTGVRVEVQKCDGANAKRAHNACLATAEAPSDPAALLSN